MFDALVDWCDQISGMPPPDGWSLIEWREWLDEVGDRLAEHTDCTPLEVTVRFALLARVAADLPDSELAMLRADAAGRLLVSILATPLGLDVYVGDPHRLAVRCGLAQPNSDTPLFDVCVNPNVTADTLRRAGAYVGLIAEDTQPYTDWLALFCDGRPVKLASTSGIGAREHVVTILHEHFLPAPNRLHVEVFDGFEVEGDW
jgi:hypothetical protein